MEHFSPDIQIDLPKRKDIIINAVDFGARNQTGFCNTRAFRSAIDACRQTEGAVLCIPKGVYHFYNAPEDMHLPLHDLSDVTIEGNGSELIFHTPVAYWDIRNCRRVYMKNLTMDWAWEDAPLATVGRIASVAEDGSFIDIVFPACQKVPLPFEIRIVGPFDPWRYTPGFPGGFEFRPYQNGHIHLTGDPAEDEKMRRLVRELSQILKPGAERLEANALRFYTQDPRWAAEHFKPGQCYNFRHFEYDGVAVRTSASSHITFERITLYGCPGHGFLSNGYVSHLHFDDCRILPRPGTARSISVSVDCLHVGNSQGNILIEDCDFSAAGDDCINLHDNSCMGVRRMDDYTLLALRASRANMLLERGSRIELRNPDLSPLGYRAEVMEARYQPDGKACLLKLSEPLPKYLPAESVIFHTTFHTDNYVIRNCRFTNNRARGALLQGSHGLVEGNLFENIQGAAIQIETGCESRWSEGQGVTDLLIQNNVIRHCDLNAWQMAVIYMGVYLPNGRTDYPVFEDVELCKNTIIDCPRLACFCSSCKNVWVHDNAIINAGQIDYSIPCYGSSTMEEPVYAERYHGVIQFAHAQDCVVERNCIVACVKNAKAGTDSFKE